MRKKRNSILKEFSMLFLFSINFFLMIISLLAIAGITTVLLRYFKIITNDFYTRPETWLILIYAICLLIGIFTIIMLKAVLVKPMHKMIEAVNELAKGNFDIRVKLDGKEFAREVKEFAKSFNTAASELQSVEILRKDFVNNFSHEFKTPIVSIGGFAQLLAEGNLTKDESEEYIQIIISESNRLAALASNVLELSKIESQVILTDKKVFCVSEQIRRAILMMDSKCSSKNLEFDLQLEEIDYYGNAKLLNQVWINLLDNAIKFSPNSGTLFVKTYSSQNTFTFQVRDQGPGMNDRTKEHIFDKFYQGDTSHASEGNGLGMTMVQKVLALHNGKIKIDSIIGNGTTISITLPKQNEYE